ncbi:hypothetical protein IEQ34_010153 [Dendrobium chrysotoxum]|uniref:Uncharacterized protein n=1 Tax=Dendrobium chrysotoxum TaxID=161865 RepID=A0AAV7H4Y2_DENCH|nr:hypothetical protein IEQ34_010153 [Dendrobium chrysotoxum]
MKCPENKKVPLIKRLRDSGYDRNGRNLREKGMGWNSDAIRSQIHYNGKTHLTVSQYSSGKMLQIPVETMR